MNTPEKSVIYFLWLLSLAGYTGCRNQSEGEKAETLFRQLDPVACGITFQNQVQYSREYNTYTYRNFYNGAGVGIGDINNDGLQDIYFCGNLADNKLYLNRGNFRFEDITEKAGVACPDVWSTGVSMVDINGDGWLDIYVCKSGDPNRGYRKNELFINNGDLTFTEKAKEYGLDDLGLSTHANFFDYDRDGDLDCYLLNNSFNSVADYELLPGMREVRDTLGGNKLYRNDGGHYVDVSAEAGIYGSRIGFGLGVSVADVNRDGWPDIYVSNDFFERDYLYINNRDGTFREELPLQIRETSQGAMGADIADLNNDAYPEIFTTEMTPEGIERYRTKAVFDTWETYRIKVENGYHHQFNRNVLQRNNRNSTFSELGRFAGVSMTDWSWGALIMDLDNDGWQDIFVANGIYKDLLDRDYLEYFSSPDRMRSMIRADQDAILTLIDRIPSERVSNYCFHNNHNLTFTNKANIWGLGMPSFSGGSAYGDLDNDGDLDLVINNVNMAPFLMRNQSDHQKNHYLILALKGSGANTEAVGAEVTIYTGSGIQYREHYPVRGFKSTVDARIHFGLAADTIVDSVRVIWPDGKVRVVTAVPADTMLTLDYREAKSSTVVPKKLPAPLFRPGNLPSRLDFRHQENDFNDFKRNRLLYRMFSAEGPRMAVGDVNGDHLSDIYFCGAREQAGELFVQNAQGAFRKAQVPLFSEDRIAEDVDCAFFDADNDGDLDLYVASGSSEFPSSSSALADRLYFNDGSAGFRKSKQVLPAGKFEYSSCVRPADVDGDGDIDLFVGTRMVPFAYGLPGNGYILINDGQGIFTPMPPDLTGGLQQVGMITDMAWDDLDGDKDPDIILVGDWMPVKVFLNEQGHFRDASADWIPGGTEGWWNRLVPADLNQDGRTDFVLGNHGLNSMYRADTIHPLTMYVNDFDMNGTVEQIICRYFGDRSYPVAQLDDLWAQIPSLEEKFPDFHSYRNATISDLFDSAVINRSLVLKAVQMRSVVLIHRDHKFRIVELPDEAQLAPVFAAAVEDFDRDGIRDIVLGGNLYRTKPETGIYDALYGLFLKGTGRDQWIPVPADTSGLVITGEVRDLKPMKINNDRKLFVLRNNDSLKVFIY